jgi:pimeloyl-ACP methyl ester carboxylesterase
MPDRPRIVLLHGLGGAAAVWAGVLAALAPHAEVETPELPGHGRAGGPYTGGPLTIAALAERLLGETSGRSVLVGHSIGSAVVLEAARRAPDRVAAVVTVGGAEIWPEEFRVAIEARAQAVEAGGVEAVVDQVLATGLHPATHAGAPHVVGLLRELMVRTDRAGYAACCRAIATADRPVDLAAIRPPVHCVVGDRDLSTPPAFSGRIAAAARRGSMTVLPRAAHWCMVERPFELAAEILRVALASPAG